jgi:hypothetical protein
MIEHIKRAVKIEPCSALKVTVGNPFLQNCGVYLYYR